VRAAREEADELNRLITDLLDLARYGESAVDRQHVRLDLLTEEILERFRTRVPDVALHSALEPSLVLVDAGAVGHAISNLIENAIKWSPPGAEVSVTVRDGRVTVVDCGPGIADSDLPHIFERFYRADTARGRPGSGLGLAIVGRVAELNDGTVSVRTGPEGSAFAIAFPPAGDTETLSHLGDVEHREIERLEERH